MPWQLLAPLWPLLLAIGMCHCVQEIAQATHLGRDPFLLGDPLHLPDIVGEFSPHQLDGALDRGLRETEVRLHLLEHRQDAMVSLHLIDVELGLLHDAAVVVLQPALATLFPQMGRAALPWLRSSLNTSASL